jgi:hypothetical protein
MEESLVSLKQSSIEVNKTSKGDYSFSVKIYYDDSSRAWKDVITDLQNIHSELQKRFK